MKRIVLIASVLAITLFSCQKEIDWGLGGTASGKQLVKISSKTGADSTIVEYFYDGSKRLAREKTTGAAAGTSLDNDLTIVRNSSGIITKTIQKAAALTAAGIDSVVTRFYYNTGSSKYTATAFDLSIPGIAITDSAVYTYDANGRITRDSHYLAIGGLPIPLPAFLAARNTYTYSADGKNILSVATEAAIPPATTLAPAAAQTYTIDTKVNPLIISNEAILLNRVGLYNANNTTKAIVTNAIDPTQDLTTDYTFKYNTENKPDSSYGTRTPGGSVTASKYFYQ